MKVNLILLLLLSVIGAEGQKSPEPPEGMVYEPAGEFIMG